MAMGRSVPSWREITRKMGGRLTAATSSAEAVPPWTSDDPPPFEAFREPGICQSLLRSGWGTRVPYKKGNSVAQEDYSKLFDDNGYYRISRDVSGYYSNLSHRKIDKSASSSTSEEQPPTYSLEFENSIEIPFGERVIIFAKERIDCDERSELSTSEEEPVIIYAGEGIDEGSERSEMRYQAVAEQLEKDVESEKVKRRSVKNWAYVNFSGISDKEASKFLRKLIKMCVNIRMDFDPLPTRSTHVHCCCNNEVEKTLLLLDFNLARDFSMGENQIGLLIVFLPDCTHSHETVERVCRSLRIVYQCFSSQDARALDKESLETAALEIKHKVIQGHHTGDQQPIVHHSIPFLSEAPTVIIGADVSCSGPREDISVASVVASMDWPGANKYRALVSYQPYTELAIKDLFNPDKDSGGILSEILLAFKEQCKRWPERIIFFRNGGIGDQLRETYNCEIVKIKNACSLLAGNIPSVTFVVVAEKTSNGSQMCEVVTGSEFGEHSSIPMKFEFSTTIFREGTTVHYCVLTDENNFTQRQFESLCNDLHTLRIRLTYPKLSMVPPSYFAQEAAFNARNYAEKHVRLRTSKPAEGNLPKYFIP